MTTSFLSACLDRPPHCFVGIPEKIILHSIDFCIVSISLVNVNCYFLHALDRLNHATPRLSEEVEE